MAHAPRVQDISPMRAWLVLVVLGVLSMVSFLDRTLLSLLVKPIKEDLSLSDLQIGVLYGTVFAISYGLFGVICGRLADIVNRQRMILVGVAVWSFCTIGYGFISSFALLLLLRVGLAAGEAALSPSVHSMVGDMFPPKQRQTAASVYQTMGFLGAGLGTIAAGWVIHRLTLAVASGALVTDFAVWQMAFILLGIPPLLIAALFALTCREPARTVQPSEPGASNRELVAFVKTNARIIGGLFLGASLMLTMNGAFMAWGPEFIRRTYDWDIERTATAIGVLNILAVTSSTLLGPVLTRWINRSGRKDGVVLVALCGAAAGTVVSSLGFVQADPYIFLVCQFAAMFLVSGGGNNVLFALQDIAPARMRGTLVGILFASFHVFALGLGPPMTAVISGMLSQGEGALGPALALQSAIVGIPAVLVLLWARGAHRIPSVAQPAV